MGKRLHGLGDWPRRFSEHASVVSRQVCLNEWVDELWPCHLPELDCHWSDCWLHSPVIGGSLVGSVCRLSMRGMLNAIEIDLRLSLFFIIF